MSTNKKILIALVTHGDAYKGALQKLIRYCGGLSAEKKLIVVENSLAGRMVEKTDDWVFKMGGDNSVYEFSAWQKAIESDTAREFDPDVYLFVTSAFIEKKFYAMPVITDMIVSMVRENKLFGGNLRQLPFSVKYKGLTLNPYLSTHCFFMSREIVRKLGTMVSERAHKEFIEPENSGEIFTKSEIWNDRFKKYVSVSLTNKYHKKGIRVSPEHYDFFRRKLLSIANEMLLSGRVRKLGYKTVDLTPFPRFLNSPATVFIFGTTIRPFQFLRKIIIGMLYGLFCNSFSDQIGLERLFLTVCVNSVKQDLKNNKE